MTKKICALTFSKYIFITSFEKNRQDPSWPASRLMCLLSQAIFSKTLTTYLISTLLLCSHLWTDSYPRTPRIEPKAGLALVPANPMTPSTQPLGTLGAFITSGDSALCETPACRVAVDHSFQSLITDLASQPPSLYHLGTRLRFGLELLRLSLCSYPIPSC